ncbi:MAG: NUDIX domain-containing protein [Candidatus Binatia bacterium]
MVIRPGVSAVIFSDAGVLLQRRDDNGLWGLPGGAVEPGESLRVAVVREVREETGLVVEPVRVIGVYSAPENHQVMTYPDGNVIHYISTALECVIVGGEIVCGAESLELGWFAPDAPPADLMPVALLRLRDALARQPRAFLR